MGALFSALYWNRRLRAGPLSELQAEFDTGDIVLFAGRGFSAYLTKVGTWSGFSNVGFLIREKPGPEGLMVCHSGARPRRASPDAGGRALGRVKLSRLEQYLESGGFDLVLVRKLQRPLSDRERAEVVEFARECRGKLMNRRVSLLMASGDLGDLCAYCCCALGCCTGRPGVERLFCSELVASMLERVHRVEASQGGGEYLPTVPPDGGDGRVLMPPINVKVPERMRSLRLPAKPPGAAHGGSRRRAPPGDGNVTRQGGSTRESDPGSLRRHTRSASGGPGHKGRHRHGDGHRRSKSHNTPSETLQPS